MSPRVNDTPYPTFPPGFKVWIEGTCFRGGAVDMFARAGCKAATSPEEADLVVFLGGEDVDPALYGEKPHKSTHFNPKRDEREIELFGKCIANDIPMFGICRGMQFIHVMSGGKLWQNVLGHHGEHKIIDVETGDELMASSIHHQMCIENDKLIPLAYAVPGTTRSSIYETAEKALHTDTHKDLEAAVYLEQRAIAVQGHPEICYGNTYTKWCLNRILDFLAELSDMDRVTVTKKAAVKATGEKKPVVRTVAGKMNEKYIEQGRKKGLVP